MFYFDTDDFRLRSWGVTVQYAEGDGWTVRFPASRVGAATRARTERRYAGDCENVPHELRDLVRAFVRYGSLHKIAETYTPRYVRGEIERADLEIGEIALAPRTRRSGVADVLRRALAVSVASLVHADAHVQLNEDVEWIHRAHAATRALREDLRLFAPLLDRAASLALTGRLHELADQFGSIRDHDVFLAHVTAFARRLSESDRASTDDLLERSRTTREDAYAKLLLTLREDAYLRLLEDIVRLAGPDSPLIVRPTAMRRKTLAREVISKPWRRLKRAVMACGKTPGAVQLHAVRIKVKRCRCALEAIAPVIRKNQTAAARRLLRRLKDLQETLGTVHDAVNEGDRLRAQTSATLDRFAVGELAGLENATAAGARATWRKAWKRASRPGMHFWKKRPH